MQILDSTAIYKGAPLEDINMSADLSQTGKPLDDYDIIKLLKVSEQFVKEQQKGRKFRLHGTINLISQLNNRPKQWTALEVIDSVMPRLATNYAMDREFDFYVGYTKEFVPVFGDNSFYYQRKIKLLSQVNAVDVFSCGFSQNVFQEKVYNYVIENEIDVTDLYSTGLPASCPVTELFIYCKPKATFSALDFSGVPSFNNFAFAAETTKGFSSDFVNDTSFQTRVVDLLKPADFALLLDAAFYNHIIGVISFIFKSGNVAVTYPNILYNKDLILAYAGLSRVGTMAPFTPLSATDEVMGDVVFFNTDEMTITDVLPQQYEIMQAVDETITIASTEKWANLGFIYTVVNNELHIDFHFLVQPFQKVSLLDFSDFLETETLGNLAETPPFSLADPDNALIKWRDVLDPGYIEQTSKKGFDYPFINDCHYVFNEIKLFMKPNLADYNTYRLFKSAINTVSINSNTFTI
jgi:hypothetical protein